MDRRAVAIVLVCAGLGAAASALIVTLVERFRSGLDRSLRAVGREAA